MSNPKNIGFGDLMKYKFPATAIASILHRISGVLLFLMIPSLICALDESLKNQQSFLMVAEYFQSPLWRFLLWLFFSSLFYHVLAGIKHLFMDMGFFETMRSGRVASSLVIVISLVAAVLLGIELW